MHALVVSCGDHAVTKTIVKEGLKEPRDESISQAADSFLQAAGGSEGGGGSTSFLTVDSLQPCANVESIIGEDELSKCFQSSKYRLDSDIVPTSTQKRFLCADQGGCANLRMRLNMMPIPVCSVAYGGKKVDYFVALQNIFCLPPTPTPTTTTPRLRQSMAH